MSEPQHPPSPPSPPATPPGARAENAGRIDFAHLARYTGGDAALEAEVLGMFGEQVEMWLRMLDPEGDGESWTSAAHAIKGSAATVGATRLAELCARAENSAQNSAQNSDTTPAAKAWLRDEIEAEAGHVRADIQRWQYKQKLSTLRGG